LSEIEIKELEWYLRDYFFRQYKQGNQEFNRENIAKEMISVYLRYRNSDWHKLAALINSVVESLISRLVLKQQVDGGPIQLTSELSRLQCSKCFYISYLGGNEPIKCLRCSAEELHEFPIRKH
jgi:hypothetical protein